MRRLITACNEFEWRGAHETSLSRKGCDMLADVVHESLEITEYRYHPSFSRPSLSLSLSLFSASTPWQPTSCPGGLQPHPSLRLIQR